MKFAELQERHDAESADLKASYLAALEDFLGRPLTEQERSVEMFAMVDEQFPSHHLRRHEFYQSNPDLGDEGRVNFYRDHREFTDETGPTAGA